MIRVVQGPDYGLINRVINPRQRRTLSICSPGFFGLGLRIHFKVTVQGSTEAKLEAEILPSLTISEAKKVDC